MIDGTVVWFGEIRGVGREMDVVAHKFAMHGVDADGLVLDAGAGTYEMAVNLTGHDTETGRE